MRVLSLTHTTPWPLALRINKRPDGVAVEAKDLALGDDLEANITVALEAAEAAGKGSLSEAVVIDVEANFGKVGYQVTDDEATAVLRTIMARCPRFEGLYFYSGNEENVAAYGRVLEQDEFAATREKTALYVKGAKSPVLANLRGLKVTVPASSSVAASSPERTARAARREERARTRQSGDITSSVTPPSQSSPAGYVSKPALAMGVSTATAEAEAANVSAPLKRTTAAVAVGAAATASASRQKVRRAGIMPGNPAALAMTKEACELEKVAGHHPLSDDAYLGRS